MTDIVAFLAAVHSADEQAARAAECLYGPWEHPHEDEGELNEVTIFPERGGAIIVATTTANDEGHAEAAHIARHDPQSVLARVEAERRICAEARQALDEWAPHGRAWDHESETGRARSGVYEDVLRVLAWGYRHRDGFDARWAPDGAETTA